MMNKNGSVTISKRAIFVVVGIIAIILVSLGAYLYYTHTTSNQAAITGFQKLAAGQLPSGGGTQEDWPFTVTVSNQGSNDVSGLTVYVRMYQNGQELGSDSTQLSTLQAGHTETLDLTIWIDYNVLTGQSVTYTATLEMNGNVISHMNLP